jgi:altered-inheritance-of-mitochondria protein 5
VPVGIVETAKDKWNRSLEEGVKRVYNTDWRRVREDRASVILQRIRESK